MQDMDSLRAKDLAAIAIAGYGLMKLNIPLVLVLVLGDMAEANFRNAMISSDGSLSVFWPNEPVGIICGLAVMMLLWPLLSHGLRCVVALAAKRSATG